MSSLIVWREKKLNLHINNWIYNFVGLIDDPDTGMAWFFVCLCVMLKTCRLDHYFYKNK